MAGSFTPVLQSGVTLGRLLADAAQESKDVNITWEGGLVVATLIIALITMAFDLVGPDFIFAGLASLYMAARIITVSEGSTGFSNTGVLTVVALYVVAEGIAQTGGLERLMSGVLGQKTTAFWATVRMFLPTFFAAAFLNNTPIVALLIPIVVSWGTRRGVSPKRLLIPLSYATILGGTCTLIGTSTNLVVAGLQQDRYMELGQPENARFGFFDITPYGISYAVFGFLYIAIAARWLLPSGLMSKQEHGLVMAMRIKPGSGMHHKTVRQAGLKGMEELFLVSVSRDGHMMHAVAPDFLLEEGDDMYFSGNILAAERLAAAHDLELLTADTEASGPLAVVDGDDPEQGGESVLPAKSKLVQVCVKKGADIVGCRVSDSRIKERFSAQVVAIKRGAEALPPADMKLNDLVLDVGDVLVLVADDNLELKDKPFRALFKDVRVVDSTQEKEYMTGMRVQDRARMIGKTLGEAGLTGVNGLVVVAIDRQDGTLVRDVAEGTAIQGGDILWFSGSLEGVAFLMRLPGLANMHEQQVAKLGISVLERRLVQASVALDSPLAGFSVRDAQFRSRFDAVVISISRHGVKLPQDVRDVKLQPGDVLLLDTGSEFMNRYKSDKAFNLMTEVPNTSPLKTSRMWWALLLVGALISTQVVSGSLRVDLINLFPGAVLVAGVMIATHCMTGEQARRAINWDVYVCIAFAFAVSAALEKTTVAQGAANVFQSISEAIGGETAALVIMYLATGMLSEIITNNAAAALMYPIASRMGDVLAIDPKYISISVMLGASASFITPIGYQCNLMVYAAGGYKTWEFMRFGTPLQVVQFCAVIIIFALKDQPWVVAAISTVTVLVFLAGAAAWTWFVPDAFKRRLLPAYFKQRSALLLSRAE